MDTKYVVTVAYTRTWYVQTEVWASSRAEAKAKVSDMLPDIPDTPDFKAKPDDDDCEIVDVEKAWN
jgi:hypothetical protein